MIKFPVTGFTTQSLYYPQIIHITLVKIIAACISCHVIFCSADGFFIVAFVGRTKALNKSKPCGLNCYHWSELNYERTVTNSVYSEYSASQFCSVLLLSYKLSSVLVHSQPKGMKQKMRRHKQRSSVTWQGASKQKGVKPVLPVYEWISRGVI